MALDHLGEDHKLCRRLLRGMADRATLLNQAVSAEIRGHSHGHQELAAFTDNPGRSAIRWLAGSAHGDAY